MPYGCVTYSSFATNASSLNVSVKTMHIFNQKQSKQTKHNTKTKNNTEKIFSQCKQNKAKQNITEKLLYVSAQGYKKKHKDEQL